MNIRSFARSHSPLLLSIVAIVVVSASLTVWANSANIGEVAKPGNKILATIPPYKAYDGKYVTFKYRGVYAVQFKTARDMDLELASFVANTNYEKRLSLSISRLQNNSLETNSGYLLRQAHPEMYTKRMIYSGDITAVIWDKSDGQEETAFIAHGDKVAVLSFLAAGTLENLQPEVDNVLESFQWKG